MSTWEASFLQLKKLKLSKDTKTFHPPAELKFIEAMQSIAREYGKLADKDENGIWVGYEPQSENENYEIGVKCANCAHFESSSVCKIIKKQIEPGGYCRLAAIPSGLIKNEKSKRS